MSCSLTRCAESDHYKLAHNPVVKNDLLLKLKAEITCPVCHQIIQVGRELGSDILNVEIKRRAEE